MQKVSVEREEKALDLSSEVVKWVGGGNRQSLLPLMASESDLQLLAYRAAIFYKAVFPEALCCY